MASAIGDLVVRLNANTRNFDRGMSRSTKGLGSFAAAGAIAGVAAAGVTAALNTMANVARRTIGSIRSLGSAGLEFNANMRSSLAIMGNVSDDTRKQMEAAAFSAAKATGQSASDMAQAYYFLASAGMNAEQAIAALPAVAKFAAAGNFDLATATDLSTDAQSALGMVSKDAAANLANLTRVTDVLIGANTLANASAQQFSEALTGGAGAALKTVGKDIEEGVAVLAAFADQGIKGAEAGTQFGIVMRDLQTKAIQNAKAFETAGVAVFDSSGEMRNIGGIIGDLEDSLAGMSDMAQKTALMELGFSDKSVKSIQTLLGTSDKIKQYESRLREMGGVTEDVANKQLGPFEKGWNALTVSVTQAGAALMKWAGPILGKAAEQFSVMAEAVTEMIQSSTAFQRIGDGIVDVVANAVANIDVMLGSWEGFKAGIVYAMDSAKNSLLTIWEDITYQIKRKMLELSHGWFMVTDAVIGGVELQSKALKTLVPGLDAIKQSLALLYDSQSESGTEKQNAALRELEIKHMQRKKQLAGEGLDIQAKWLEAQSTQPKLSDRMTLKQDAGGAASASGGSAADTYNRGMKAMWDTYKGMASSAWEWGKNAAANAQQPPTVGGPQETEQAGGKASLAGAMLRGSSEAYSTIVQAMTRGGAERVQTKILTESQKQTRHLENLDRSTQETKTVGYLSIPV